MDEAVLGHFLDKKLGRGSFDSEALAHAMRMMWTASQIIPTAQAKGMSKQQLDTFCSKEFGLYGATGSVIPGLLTR